MPHSTQQSAQPVSRITHHTPATLPIVTFVGKKNSGKTTFLTKVVAELTRRGIRVATVKHHAHPSPVDGENTDSARFGQAGARVTMVSSSSQLSIVHAMEEEATMERIAQEACAAHCDVLIAEGFKRLSYQKIELSRVERSDASICEPCEVEAFVTNNPALAEKFSTAVPVFGLDDIEEFCNYFVRHSIEGQPHE